MHRPPPNPYAPPDPTVVPNYQGYSAPGALGQPFVGIGQYHPGPPDYEFTEAQNKVIRTVARWTLMLGIFTLVLGLFQLLSLGLLGAAVELSIGGAIIVASQKFRSAVTSTVNNTSNLVAALRNLSQVMVVRSALLLLAGVLLCFLAVGSLLLMAAIH